MVDVASSRKKELELLFANYFRENSQICDLRSVQNRLASSVVY